VRNLRSPATPIGEERRDEAQRRPAVLRLAWSRTVVELKTFFRDQQAALFTFLLPVMLLVVFSAIFTGSFSGPPGEPVVYFRQYFAAGMIASGIFSASFASLAIGVAIEQHDGLLKRLGGTPLPRAAYFVGKIAAITVVSALSTLAMLAIGVAFYGLDLPAGASQWLALGWVFALGVAACSLLGLAYTRAVRTAKGAPAVVQPPYLLLQFTSGVFFVYTDLPDWMQRLAAVFPLKWMAQGLRYALLPDWFHVAEPTGSWEIDTVALVLVAWAVAGFCLTLRFFVWDRSDATPG
jgi:ABC-2 type transport system permease protein